MVTISSLPPVDAGVVLGRQPLLHELVTCLSAPCVVLSERSGQIRPEGAQGVLVADLRVLREAVVSIDDAEPEPISASQPAPGAAEFVGIVRSLGDVTPDPTVWLRRHRQAGPAGVIEHLRLVNRAETAISTSIEITLAADLLDVEQIKAGATGARADSTVSGNAARFQHGGRVIDVSFPDARLSTDAGRITASWPVVLEPRSATSVSWSLTVRDPDAVVTAVSGRPALPIPVIACDDRRLAPFVTASVADLQALRMALVTGPANHFVAAGSPWYCTLFGRDSIWTARMSLPLGTEVAAGTLRTLAALQGTTVDPATDEQPGKILHELRRSSFDFEDRFLPPVYYGTVDATPLWVCLLADAWRWGLPDAEVSALIPAMERALQWMVDSGDADGDGFLDYHDEFGRGLTNQGWKDSGDSIRFADGTVAVGPVALAEVQGYAYEAALAGAELLDAFGRPGAERWRAYAAQLAERFRASFWVADELGPFPALALDGHKRPVDAPASNMGHLLGTGILSSGEAAAVAARLVDPSMASGFGLRTMANTAGGYSPLSYHCGSVWPHDTAIAVHGLVRAGFSAEAALLGGGILAAGAAFGGRLPELFGGFAADDVPVPVPYPASCRPQAWAAASAVVLLQAFLGLEPDVPNGVVRLHPAVTGGVSVVGALSVDGLRVGGQPFSVSVGSDGGVRSVNAPPGLTVRASP